MDPTRGYHDSAAYLLARASRLLPGEQFWLGIAGPPGAGKSTLCEKLLTELDDIAIVLPMDGYHFSRAELDRMPDPENAHRCRGAPFTFDAERFVRDLERGRAAGSGLFPSFDHGAGDPVEGAIRLVRAQHKMVLVEGNYLLLDGEPWKRLRSVFDETWYLDVDVAICKERVYRRHLAAGRDAATARFRVETNDGPNARLVASESPRNADRILRED